MQDRSSLSKEERRLRRQFDALGRAVPPSRRLIRALLAPERRMLRVPIALVLIAGGFLSFLPVLGLWMLPLGLMLLAVDAKALAPVISRNSIRLRARARAWRRQRRTE